MWKQWSRDRPCCFGLQNHTDGDCSHEIKRWLLLGRNAMTHLQSIVKSRGNFADKGPSSQSYGFSGSHIWMLELNYKEGWALKNWCFELWCWRRLLRVLCTARRSNQSILKEIFTGIFWIFIGRTAAEAETPILWPPDAKNCLHWKRPWCWERLRAGGEADHIGLYGWMALLTQWIWVLVDSGNWWWEAWHAVVHGFANSQTWLSDWTELNWTLNLILY